MNLIRSFSLLFVAFSLFIISGCSQTSTLIDDDSSLEETPPEYSLIFYIHGDSDYLFHFEDGTPGQADENALLKATEVAEQAGKGEVFIFHQLPAKKRFWLFPGRTSEMIHYRNGQIVNHVSYRHNSDQEFFLADESDLYHQFRSEQLNEHNPKHFLYFGHEIPDQNGTGYHTSQPKITVNTATFANGIDRFLTSENERFDLIVLSTCNNGSAAMVKQLTPIANYLLASPQNLHLSHIDLGQLSTLEENPRPSTYETVLSIATESFNRLTQSIQTTVTLSIYNLNVVKDYIDDLYTQVKNYEDEQSPDPYRENIDCKDLNIFQDGEYTLGVETLFRPARFGLRSENSTHSGWGCKGI